MTKLSQIIVVIPLLLIISLPLHVQAQPAASTDPTTSTPPAARKKIVLIAGEKSHGPEGNRIHDYPWSVRLLKVMLEHSNIRDQVQVRYFLNGWPEDPAPLTEADTIMVISDGRDGDRYSEAPFLQTAERVAFVQKQIDRGCGFITFHFSTFAPDAYGDQLLDWVGGYFDWETDGQRQWYSAITTMEAAIELENPTHPVNRGVAPFEMREEFYYNIRFRPDQPGLTPLWKVPALDGRPELANVVAWALQRPDGGRGFGTTCGHFYDNWQHPNFRKLILNAIAWTAHLDIPPDGVIAPFFTHEEILAALERSTAGFNPLTRDQMPLYLELPAAAAHDLTPSLRDSNSPGSHPTAGQWFRSHANHASDRFSPLQEINRTNVAGLEIAWVYRSGDGTGNVQANPIIVDGTVYTPTPGHHLVALDGGTGKELWRFKAPDRPAFRGLTFWRDPAGRKCLLFNAEDHLWMLDATTGRPVESFGSGGKLHTGHFRVAPAIFEDRVLIAGYAGDAVAYHLTTGQQLWTFHTIPKPDEPNSHSWEGPGTGANCWGGTALDVDRGIFFLTTGSPKPNFVGTGHRGRNLYANCLLAIDARTGKLLWHFQEIRHDIWDLDIPAPPILTTIRHDGRRIDVVAAVTKMGNTLLLDRVTGKSIFPFRMRRAPASPLSGEYTWPYQPDLALPEPFARQQFTLDDITDRTPEAFLYVSNVVRHSNIGWFEPFTPGRRTIFYAVHGGAEWTGAAADPRNAMLYVSANEVPWIVNVFPYRPRPKTASGERTTGETLYHQLCATCHGHDRQGVGVAPPLLALDRRTTEEDVRQLLKTGRGQMPVAPELPRDQETALLDFLFDRDIAAAGSSSSESAHYTATLQKLIDHQGYPGSKPPWGTLNAINLNTGRIEWKVPLGQHAALAQAGQPDTGTENFGGPIVTAGGLVFCAGTRDRMIRAFDSESGRELWKHELPFAGTAPPATYTINGRQFLLVPATGGGKLHEAWFDLPSNENQTIAKGGEPGDAFVAFALPLAAAGQ